MFGQALIHVRSVSYPHKAVGDIGHSLIHVIFPSYDHFAGTEGHFTIHNAIPVDLSPHKLP